MAVSHLRNTPITGKSYTTSLDATASALRMAQPRMVTEPVDHVAPNPVLSRDLAVLIGLLAVLEGELGAGEVPQHLVGKLRDRFARKGLLKPEASDRDLRQAISDLNHG